MAAVWRISPCPKLGLDNMVAIRSIMVLCSDGLWPIRYLLTSGGGDSDGWQSRTMADLRSGIGRLTGPASAIAGARSVSAPTCWRDRRSHAAAGGRRRRSSGPPGRRVLAVIKALAICCTTCSEQAEARLRQGCVRSLRMPSPKSHWSRLPGKPGASNGGVMPNYSRMGGASTELSPVSEFACSVCRG